MLTKFDYTNAETSTVYNFNNDVAPMSDLDITVTQRTDRSRTKSQRHGIYATFTYRGEMEIHIEGNLNADSAADFVTKRLALAEALFGDPNDGTSGTHPTVRKNGSLAIRLDGQTEDFLCDVSIDAFSGPVSWDASAHGAYLVTFFSPDPWFVGASTSNKYYWS